MFWSKKKHKELVKKEPFDHDYFMLQCKMRGLFRLANDAKSMTVEELEKEIRKYDD